MRKRTINHLSDTIFWYLIYLLPVITYCVMLASRRGGDVVSISAWFDTLGIPVLSDLVSTTLAQIFGADGILPLYGSAVGIPIFSWYVSMMIIHLAVDVLLFIPRLAHKWIDNFCKGE